MREPKRTDIWMPLYIGEYLADTMGFNTEQHGAYLLILMACWREKGAPISGADEDLATVAGLTVTRWRAIKAKLLAKFIVAEDGSITHKRAIKEVQRAEKVSKARSEAGKNGAAKRWQKDGKAVANAMAEPSQNDGQSQSQVTRDSVPYGTGSEDAAGAEPAGVFNPVASPAQPPTPAPQPPSDRDRIFAEGVPLLTAAGVSEKNARSMLASLANRNGDANVVAAITRCAIERPVQPVSWLQAALKNAPAGATSRNNPGGNRFTPGAAAIYDGAEHV